jgi:hypothetical protein
MPPLLPLRRSMAAALPLPLFTQPGSAAYGFHLASLFPIARHPETNPFAATSLVRSHGSAPAAMDELCLQRIVGTDHRAALEGSGRGSPPRLWLEEAIDASYFAPSQQQ